MRSPGPGPRRPPAALIAAALIAAIVLTLVGGASGPDTPAASSALSATGHAVDAPPPTAPSATTEPPPRGPAAAGPDAYASSAPPTVAPPTGPESAPPPTPPPADEPPKPTEPSDSSDADLPETLPATEPEAPATPLIVLDPGHGGTDTGALSGGIVERESNLDIARRVEEILLARGYRVSLTRRDAGFSVFYPDGPVPEAAEIRTDLQARVDFANALDADVFVSIHSNQSLDSGQRGLEVWYNSQRPYSLANYRLAARLHDAVVVELVAYGYPVAARGVLSDACHSFDVELNRCLPLFVLAPRMLLMRDEVVARGLDPDRFAFLPGEDVLITRATEMPAALAELLFQSNPADAAMLRTPGARQAMARGVARAIVDFLESDDRTRPPDAGEPADLSG